MSRDIISHSNYLNQLSIATLPINIKGFFNNIINWIYGKKNENNINTDIDLEIGLYNESFIYNYDKELHLSPLSTRSDPSEPSLSPPPPSPI
jgi:hypothetical protein